MMRQCVAVVLMTLLGACAPVLADDFVSPRFTTPVKSSSVNVALLSGYLESAPPGLTARFELANTDAAHLFQDPTQQQPAQPASPAPPHRHWTKRGKVLTIVGLGLVGTGVGLMFRSSQEYPTCDNGKACSNILTAPSSKWKDIGGGIAGAGGVLIAIGLTRRSD
jgi:hypothetical protein